jgi:hypothetical protein
MKRTTVALMLCMSISACDTRSNIERNPQAWKEWDYSVHGVGSDGYRIVGDITMDKKGADTGAGTIMDERGIENEVKVKKIGDKKMSGVGENGITYDLIINPLRYGEPAHQ